MAGDFKALVEAAEPDSTITLQAGTYVVDGVLTIEKDLRIEAADDAVHKVIISDPAGASADKFFLQVQNCGVIFDGVIVKKSSGTPPAKGAGCVCVLDDGRVTFFNQPRIEYVF